MTLQLSFNLGHFTGPSAVRDRLALVEEVERLGYTNVWVAEVYGSDAPTVLSWLAARTTRIGIGSAVMQIPGRSPAMTAMTAATLDLLSQGRFLLGLGVSGPQVSEGWHGVRFDAPLDRTREYIDVVRKVLSRERVSHDGVHYPLPLPGGRGKQLRLTVRPQRPRVPIYLAAVGPRNLELAGAVADGWLAVFLSPEFAADQLAHVRAGLDLAGRRRADFRVVASVPVAVGDDVRRCADRVRAHAALYLGGMGSLRQNFYNRLAVRMGFGGEARRVQELYLDRRYAEAEAAVPFEFLDRTTLLGPADRIVRRLHEYAAAGVDEVAVTPFGRDLATLRAVREAFPGAGVATAAAGLTDPA